MGGRNTTCLSTGGQSSGGYEPVSNAYAPGGGSDRIGK